MDEQTVSDIKFPQIQRISSIYQAHKTIALAGLIGVAAVAVVALVPVARGNANASAPATVSKRLSGLELSTRREPIRKQRFDAQVPNPADHTHNANSGQYHSEHSYMGDPDGASDDGC